MQRLIDRRHLARLATLIMLVSLSATVQATTVKQLGLDQLTAKAEIVFHGRVLDQQTVYDDTSRRVVTVTRFEVIDKLKGSTGATHSIKQLGGSLPGSAYVHRLHGIPKFVNGESYVVFLPPVSRLGFSSPIGLMQGRFRVSLHGGSEVVSNGRDRASLLPVSGTQAKPAIAQALKTSGDSPRHFEIDSFKSVVRQLVGQ